jgi:hypothetical protein
MKMLKNTLIIAVCMSLFSSCQKIDFWKDLHHAKNITLPFEAKFFTKRNYSNDGAGNCTEAPFLSFNYQVGEGNATHLGHFTTVMHFCAAGFDYKNGEGVFVAANGDELYFKVPSEGVVGHILPYADPFYEYQFQDPFAFTGGTGRFEGASGGGMTNSFVNLFDDNGIFIPEHQTDHTWTGEITHPKSLNLQSGKIYF